MQHLYRSGKLLIAIVGKHNGELVVEAARRGGARGGTKSFGRGMVDNNTHGLHDYDSAEEDVIFTFMGEEAEDVVTEVLRAAFLDPKRLSGLALVLDVPLAFIRNQGQAVETTPDSDLTQDLTRSENMQSGTMLITSIINHGQGDDVMAVARKAGARGGTILNARGTGTEDDVKFFGISLAPEKEMLLIVADSEHAQPILDAISGLPVFNEPGGGIVFTTKVEHFYVLGH